jgi:hypothetical protein
MARESKAFGSQRGQKEHLTKGKGGVAGEVEDLRNDVEEGFQNFEARIGYPELDLHDQSVSDVVAAGGDIVLVGRELLQGQTFDKINITEGTVDLLIEMLKPGKSNVRVVFTTGAGGLVIDLTNDLLTIELPAAGQDTVDNIATAINADGADTEGIIRASMVAGTGNNITQAGQGTAEIPLAGGDGDYDYNKVMVGGLEALPANETGTTSVAKWTNTSLKVTTQAVGAAADHVQITVMSDGKRTQALTAVLA